MIQICIMYRSHSCIQWDHEITFSINYYFFPLNVIITSQSEIECNHSNESSDLVKFVVETFGKRFCGEGAPAKK